MCAIGGKIIFNDNIAGREGLIILGKACGGNAGIINFGQYSGYGGYVFMDDYCAYEG